MYGGRKIKKSQIILRYFPITILVCVLICVTAYRTLYRQELVKICGIGTLIVVSRKYGA